MKFNCFNAWRNYVNKIRDLENEEEYLIEKANHHYETNLVKKYFCLWIQRLFSQKPSQKNKQTHDDLKVGFDNFVSGLKSKYEGKPTIRNLLKSKASDQGPENVDENLKYRKEESLEEDNVDWGEEKLNESTYREKKSPKRLKGTPRDKNNLHKSKQDSTENNFYLREDQLDSEEMLAESSWDNEEHSSFSDIKPNELRKCLDNILGL